MIVDDHPLFRAGLQNALQLHDDLEIVGVSIDGEQAVTDAQTMRPDVVILDVNLPRLNGFQAMQLLIRTASPPAVVILTAHHDDEQILQAFGSGARAYANKTIHPDDLVDIIRDVCDGLYVAHDRRMKADDYAVWYRAERVRQTQASSSEDEPSGALSAREMEILAHVTDGLLNKEIAQELGISQQTVKNHVTSILRKMNVKDRTQAAVAALKRGWVRLNNDKQEN